MSVSFDDRPSNLRSHYETQNNMTATTRFHPKVATVGRVSQEAKLVVNSWTLPLASTESNRVEDSLLPLIPHAEPRAAGLAHSKKIPTNCFRSQQTGYALCWSNESGFCFVLDNTNLFLFCAGSHQRVLCWMTQPV